MLNFEEYKEPILTKEEIEYLNKICGPFKDRVYELSKKFHDSGFTQGGIYISYEGCNKKNNEFMIPFFDKNEFKGMEEGIAYTPKELEL